MKKVVILEGLPGVGKTTIVKTIEKLGLKNVYTVDELIKENIIHQISDDEFDYAINDQMKIEKYQEGTIIIDRGPISTLSYNEARAIIDENFDARPIMEWFSKVKWIYEEPTTQILYLTTNQKSYKLSYDNVLDPFGAIINEDLMEAITIFNCKKYCKNVIIKEYHKENMEEIIDEIINEYLCA